MTEQLHFHFSQADNQSLTGFLNFTCHSSPCWSDYSSSHAPKHSCVLGLCSLEDNTRSLTTSSQIAFISSRLVPSPLSPDSKIIPTSRDLWSILNPRFRNLYHSPLHYFCYSPWHRLHFIFFSWVWRYLKKNIMLSFRKVTLRVVCRVVWVEMGGLQARKPVSYLSQGQDGRWWDKNRDTLTEELPSQLDLGAQYKTKDKMHLYYKLREDHEGFISQETMWKLAGFRKKLWEH